MAKFRISSLYVDLVYQLGAVIRTFQQIEVLRTECWTFAFDGMSASYDGRIPVTYYGRGHFTAKIPEEYRKNGKSEDKIHARAMCDLFPEGDYDQWIIYYWLKYPNGVVCSSRAQKRPGLQLDRGWARTADQPAVRSLSLFPPKELKF